MSTKPLGSVVSFGIGLLPIAVLLFAYSTWDLTLWEVRFAPGPGPRQAILHAIGHAEKSIHVAAYSFTDPLIANALITVARNGVGVAILCGGMHWDDPAGQVRRLNRAGVAVAIDREHAVAADNLMIIDGEVIALGSYAFSAGAEDWASHLIVFHDRDLGRKFEDRWGEHWQHSAGVP